MLGTSMKETNNFVQIIIMAASDVLVLIWISLIWLETWSLNRPSLPNWIKSRSTHRVIISMYKHILFPQELGLIREYWMHGSPAMGYEKTWTGMLYRFMFFQGIVRFRGKHYAHTTKNKLDANHCHMLFGANATFHFDEQLNSSEPFIYGLLKLKKYWDIFEWVDVLLRAHWRRFRFLLVR